MKVKAILDEVELTLKQRGIKGEPRLILFSHLAFDLNELAGRGDWDWAMVHLDPVIAVAEDVTEYDLPDNFPDNFVRLSGDTGDKYACLLNDEYNDGHLAYQSPAQFYSRNLEAETSGRPSRYTITTKPDGKRLLILSPPPDDSYTYTIRGLYVPTDWKITEESDMPPVPGNSAIFKWQLLMRYDPSFQADYGRSYADLCMRKAKGRQARITVNTAAYR